MKKFIYDIFCLGSIDKIKWSKNFFWPISPEKTQQILNKILEINFESLEKEKNLFFRNCFLTYNHTWNPYIILFNYILLKKKLDKKKYKITFSNQSKVMNYLLRKNTKFPIIVESFHFKKEFFRSVKDKIKTVIFNLRNLKFDFNEKHFVINNKIILEQDYLKKNKIWSEVVSFETLINNNFEFDCTVFEELKKRINLIHLESLNFAKKELKIDVPDFVNDDILQYQYKYYRNILTLLGSLSKNKKIKNCSKFFLDTPKTQIRAISSLVRSHGGKVVGFPHGNWICPTLTKRPHYNEFLFYDEFVVFNKKQIPLFKKNLKNNLKYKNITFISQDSNKFVKMKKTYSYNLPKKNKTVMLLEVQLWCDDVRFEVPETMILYEFYFYLCTILTSLGYRIFFKKRPKSKKLKNFNFFKNFNNVEIIEGDLQDPKIMSLASTIIFQYGLSSTLIPMICSNIKLIYVDCGWEKWNSNVLSLLKKRCDFVKASFDPKNRIRIRVKDLEKALVVNEKNKNQEFFNKFLG